jgi:[acyl-carrier-protein] S-malonyltransferase
MNEKKLVFLFPGVGSQYTGMSKTLFDNFKIFRETIEEAGETIKIDIPSLCFFKENKSQLDKLENAQCILLAFSTASYRVYMQEIGVEPMICMGHSLGEYSALCNSGVIKFTDALNLVYQRGLIVQEVSKGIDGTMMWVVNLEVDKVENVCRNVSGPDGNAFVSAYDSTTQSSISGHTNTLMKAAKELEKLGAIVYPLKLSGPFHSPLMKEAKERMELLLQQYSYQNPQFTVLANHNAKPYTNAKNVIENLSLQLISPIRWRNSLEFLIQQNICTAIEMGPKNVLSFLLKKNTGSIQTYTTDNEKDLDIIKDKLLVKQEEYLTIIGKCLGAAVSTKNRNNNEIEYQEKAVKPYRKIEALYNQLTGDNRPPKKNDVKDALSMLKSVLTVKQTPELEQNQWFQQVLENKIINF